MIQVNYFPSLSIHAIEDITPLFLEQLPSHPIACCNWKAFPYTPEVFVKFAATPSHLLLHYHVREKSIRANYTKCNQPVWTDSCVEFFVSPDNKKTYYNFEFNCIGVPLLRYNIQPHEGPLATPELLATILTKSSLGNRPIPLQQGDITWELLIAIPYTCFFAHTISGLQGQTLFVNSYKCGDELPEPHYLSLFPIQTPEPNFHVPEFFQELAEFPLTCPHLPSY
jgi:hypothetical protein